jgi:hypothetical protein
LAGKSRSGVRSSIFNPEMETAVPGNGGRKEMPKPNPDVDPDDRKLEIRTKIL